MSRRSEQRAKRAREQWTNDLRWLLAADQGRRIVANLIDRAGLHHSAFTGNSLTYYNEGRHDYVRDLVRDLRAADLASYRRMEDEVLAAERVAEQDKALPDDDPDSDG